MRLAACGAVLVVLAACGGSGADGVPDAPAGGDDDDEVALPLQSATATFSQTDPPIFLVPSAIDGSIDNATGWAISPALDAEAAAFETVDDSPGFAAGATRLTFTLDQHFINEHALGKFRLAYTTAARDAFADGNDGSATPGDVGADAIWTVIEPASATATNASTMTIGDDGSVLAEDLSDAVYTVVGTAAATGLTGFRLEVLEDPSLPFDGPGAQNNNGNFVLAEFSVVAGPG